MKTEHIKAMITELAPVIREFVAAEQAPLLKRIADLEGRPPERGEKGDQGKPGDAGPQGERGVDGKDALPVSDEQIAAAVARYLETNPPPAGRDGAVGAPGKQGDVGPAGPQGEVGARGEQGAAGPAGADGEKGRDGRDGVGLAGALIDRDGSLVVTLTNGEHKNLGPVVGRDGVDGRDGHPGEKGADGRDGVDGLSFDEIDLIEGERGLVLRLARGAVVKDLLLPVVIDRGVWREQEYSKGAGVTWAGSFWIAQRNTSDKPDTSDAWRLAVKRGRDGKDGRAP